MIFPGLQGIKEGWYDGASIGFAVLLVVFVTGILPAQSLLYMVTFVSSCINL